MWEAINNRIACSAYGNIAQVDPKDPVAKCGMPVPADRIDQQGDVWNGKIECGGGKWGLSHYGLKPQPGSSPITDRSQTAALFFDPEQTPMFSDDHSFNTRRRAMERPLLKTSTGEAPDGPSSSTFPHMQVLLRKGLRRLGSSYSQCTAAKGVGHCEKYSCSRSSSQWKDRTVFSSPSGICLR